MSLDTNGSITASQLRQLSRAVGPACAAPADGIHPRPAGARLYARVILTAIKAGLTSRQQPTCLASPGGSA